MATAKRRTGVGTTVFLTGLLAAPLFIAPRVVRGLAAGSWVSHYAAVGTVPTPRKAVARLLVEKVDAAVNNLAPLPQAGSVAISALEIGQRIQNQDQDVEAALVIYQGVQAVCSRLRSRPWSGPGFAVIEARAAALADSAVQGLSK